MSLLSAFAIVGHQKDDSSFGCGFLESLGSVTYLMLWNLVNLIGVPSFCM